MTIRCCLLLLCSCLQVCLAAQARVAATAKPATVRVTLPDAPIVFGAAFPIAVHSDAAFDASQLSPLVVELLEYKPSGQGGDWHYRARCYELGEVTLATSPPLHLSVRTSLPEPAGELEWPSQGWRLASAPSSRWLLYGLLAMGLLSGLTWWRFLRRTASPEVETSAAMVSRWDAQAALRALSLQHSGDELFCQQVKSVVRQYCATRFHVPADVRTSEELLQLLPQAAPTLQPCLTNCDLVLFGGRNRPAAAAAQAREHALQFVATTSGEDAQVGEATA